MNNAIKQNVRNIKLEKNYNVAGNMVKAGLDNETIRKKTNSTNRLGDILEHDTLFTVYPELENLKVVFKDTNKIDGNYNKNTKSNDLIGHRAKKEIAINNT